MILFWRRVRIAYWCIKKKSRAYVQIQKYMFIIIYKNETKTGIIIANSESKNASNTPSDFTTVFDWPIVLGGNQRYVIGLDKVNTMTYSWQNVSPDYQNNIISYHDNFQMDVMILLSNRLYKRYVYYQ